MADDSSAFPASSVRARTRTRLSGSVLSEKLEAPGEEQMVVHQHDREEVVAHEDAPTSSSRPAWPARPAAWMRLATPRRRNKKATMRLAVRSET